MAYQDKLKPVTGNSSAPSYAAKLKPIGVPQKPVSLGQKVLNAGTSVANTLGFKKTADTLGNVIAKGMVPQNQRQYIPTPTGKDLAGAALNIGTTLIPVGAAEKVGASLLARQIPKLATPAAKVGVGAATGAGIDIAQDLESDKNIGLGAGALLGAAIPGASLAKNITAPKTAGRLVNSLIKPLSKQFTYGKDPGRTVAQLGIKGNSLEELQNNISRARESVGTSISDLAREVPTTVRINASKALESFNTAIRKAVDNNDQTLLNRLNEARNAITQIMGTRDGKIVPLGTRLLENLTYDQSLKVKQQLGNLTKWTGQVTEDETVNGALTRAYGSLKEQMDAKTAQVSPQLSAKLRKLNQQYADLTSAEIATKYRDVLQKRQNLVNLPGKLGLIGSAVTAPFTGGASTVALAIGALTVDKILSSPTFKTQLAAWLTKAPKKDAEKIFKLYPQVIRVLTDTSND